MESLGSRNSPSAFTTPSHRMIQLSIDDLRTARTASFDSVESGGLPTSVSISRPLTKSPTADVGQSLSLSYSSTNIRLVQQPSPSPSPSPSPAPTIPTIDQEYIYNRMDYKKELARLLARSRGTAYEKTLRRFVESKIHEIEWDKKKMAEDHDMLTASSPTGKISLAAMSKSKYDESPQKKVYSPFIKTEDSEWKERIEEMARPLDRNRYKGPDRAYIKISTNHLGRQRPPPKVTPQGYSPRTQGTEWGAAPESAPKPMHEIRNWLKGNEDWARKTMDKIHHKQQDQLQKMATQSTPRIFAKSVKLAELAQMKETQRLAGSLSVLTESPSRPGERGDATSRRSLAASSPARPVDLSDTISEPGAKLSVYDRLSIRGRIQAEKHRTWRPPPADASFSPVIDAKSRELARRYHERRAQLTSGEREGGSPATSPPAPPASSSEGMGGERALQRSHSASSIQRAQHSWRDDSHSVHTTTSQRSRMHVTSPTPSQSRKPQPSPSPMAMRVQYIARVQEGYREDRVPARVQQELERSRSRSLSRTRETDKDRAMREFVDVNRTPKPFQPTILAKETHKIMSRVKTSFEERNMKSIENMLIRKVISCRSPSPGPGHYSFSPRAVSPPPKAAHQFTSPGYRGYSFGKQRLDSSVVQGDLSSPLVDFVIDYHLPGQHGNAMTTTPKTTTTSVGGGKSSAGARPGLEASL